MSFFKDNKTTSREILKSDSKIFLRCCVLTLFFLIFASFSALQETAAAIEEVRSQKSETVSSEADLVLWPPNHEYHTIDLEDDSCIQKVTSDEPEDVVKGGDGHTFDDIIIENKSTVRVRAERQGSGNGRVYVIHYVLEDPNGSKTQKYYRIDVYHDKKDNEAIDDGPAYTVNGDLVERV